MKFLLDENVPNIYKRSLETLGFKDIIRINDFGKGMLDNQVFNTAIKEKRTIITIDTDFHAYKKEKHYGIISLSGKIKNPIELLEKVLKQINKDERFKKDSLEDLFIRVTSNDFKVGYKKKHKYKEVICKYKKN